MRLIALIALSTALSFAQDARQIVLRSLELDSRNERIARNYTFVARNETRQVDGQGRLKQRRVLTYDVTLLEGSPYTRLIARDDKPLSPAEERKEAEKLRKSIEQRRKETSARILFLSTYSEPHEASGRLYLCGFQRDEEASEGHTQWVRNKTSRFSFPSTLL
jgi:hypothetical protein